MSPYEGWYEMIVRDLILIHTQKGIIFDNNYYSKCNNLEKSSRKCGFHNRNLIDQEQQSFVSCEILAPAGKYCHVIKDFII